jgi:hypothetical protein
MRADLAWSHWFAISWICERCGSGASISRNSWFIWRRIGARPRSLSSSLAYVSSTSAMAS